MENREYKFLNTIDSPADLKRLTIAQLPIYCQELRQFIIDQLANNPGHLGSNLGTVELTVALHYVYNTPNDKLIWDVGHQAYPHKIITGRRDSFHTNRKSGGLSGFPKQSESPYDAFGGGHSSVSISAALGMAIASQLLGEERDVVAIIGDGALTGGLAFEGLNNAGASNSDLLVILNDNQMSIDPNVGAMKEYLLNITTSKRYNNFKIRVWNSLSCCPRLRRLIQSAGNALKQGMLQQSNLFESLNFRYFGPIDGHDVVALVKVLRDLKQIKGPKLLHALTQKGHGYEPAEQNQLKWHAPGFFNAETGELISTAKLDANARYQDVFGQTLLDLARTDPRIVGVTPAMPTGCSMNIMMCEMPERCFDVGIAEGHAVTFSAGLASSGLVPFCNIYSSFMQRAYDNVVHDVALQNLGVVLCLDRAGLVGEDGSTHHGAFDVAYFRPIPNIVISSPRNELELRNLMYTAYRSGVPFVIRYPRGNGVGVEWEGAPFSELPIGRGEILRQGSDVVVISLGPVAGDVSQAIERAAGDGISVAHIDIRYAKPLDRELIVWASHEFSHIITVEDGVLTGGMGSGVREILSGEDYQGVLTTLGIGDCFVAHGTIAEQKQACGYDCDGIYGAIKKYRQ